MEIESRPARIDTLREYGEIPNVFRNGATWRARILQASPPRNDAA